jgi:UDP-glucose 4-epimerase
VSELVLVTGASGFVGRRLVETLARSGTQVRAATRQPQAITFPPEVESVSIGDLAHPVDWTPLLNGVSAVVHLAGIAHVGASVAPDLYDRVIHRATAALAEAARQHGVRRFIYVSSIKAQAGATSTQVLDETLEPQPAEPYGIAKLAGERAVEKSGVLYTILRPVLVYGPGAKDNFERLMRIAALPLPLPIASLRSERSILGLDNLVAAIEFALREDRALGRTFVVADPEPVTIASLVSMIRAAMGRSAALFPFPAAFFKLALQATGRRDLWDRIGGAQVVNPARLLAAGWRPVKDTREGLLEMVRSTSQRR